MATVKNSTILQVVNLQQRTQGDGKANRYIYLVVSLKNRMSPPIGGYVNESAVEALIQGGTEVNIRV